MTMRKTDQQPTAAHGHTVSSEAVRSEPALQGTSAASAVLRLQRQIGNQQVAALMRHAAPAAAECGEVDTVLERTIEGARSAGSPLHAGVRRQMEGAMGADFSAVRVHADSRADTLSRALNARAFATGTDIFFREGEYNPGTSAGRELLAHELTHVVQSGGGVRTKLSVSEPGDDAEREADAVAKSVMQQEHDSPSDVSTPLPVAVGATPPGQVHRFWQEAKEIAGGLLGIPVALPAKPFDGDVGKTPTPATIGGGADAHASITYETPGAAPVPDVWWDQNSKKAELPDRILTVERGTSGIVRVNVVTWWHADGAPGPQDGSATGTVSARFTCDDDGVITLEPLASSTGGGGPAVTPFANPSVAGTSVEANAGVNLTQTSNQTGTNTQDRSSGESNSGGTERSTGVKVGASGKIVEGGVEAGSKSTHNQGNERKSGEQRSSATSLQTTGTNTLLFKRRVLLRAGPAKRLAAASVDGFAVNSSQMPTGTLNQVGRWWSGLDHDLKNGILRKSIGVQFVGHASAPGAAQHNQTLAQKRAEAVVQALKGFAGKDIVTLATNEGNANPAGVGEDAHDRRVDFELYRIKK